MATFYHGKPEIQPADGLQTLYLMNPTYVGYSADASATSPANSNMAFLNSTVMGNSIGQANLSLAQQQHFVGIPLHQQPESVGDHGLDRRAQYQLWNFADHQRTTSTISTPSNQGGLSLSFSTEQHKNYAIQPSNSQLPTAVSSNRGEDQVKFSGSSSSLASGVLIGSKYLKVAQELLDEVVSVSDKGVKDEPSKTTKPKDEDGSNSGGNKSSKRAGAELTTVERQEIQMKKAKLVHMLDEVEQRYRHHHHQMQIVMSSFDTIAGLGSARTYTALALKTISRQFRSLRDAISGQIRSASNSLGEEDCLTRSRSEGGSRLRFVDYQLRQQRALQQLGMMHQNAWRPQRGLPERSVSILRAWLFEHFLHPYPKDCDKYMLAKQTGLTRNQVSNWFINARVRLWKPMVEEMYLEETKEKEHHNNNNGENKSNNREEEFEPKSTFGTEQLSIPTPSSRIQTGYDDEEEGAAEEEEEEEEIIPSNIKKSRTTDHNHHHQIPQLEMDMKPMDRPNNRDHHNHHHHLLDRCLNNSGGSGGYFINEMSRFFSTDQFGQPQYSTTNGGVSLTLGLQHCEGLQFSGVQPTYLFTDPDDYSSGGNNIKPSMSPPNAYESLSLQNGKRFAAPQLLKDFVA